MAERPIPLDEARELTREIHWLGVDESGYDHYLHPVDDVVWVENPDGEIGQVQEIPSLDAYLDHIDDVAGWEEHTVDKRDLAEFLADVVERVATADDTSDREARADV